MGAFVYAYVSYHFNPEQIYQCKCVDVVLNV